MESGAHGLRQCSLKKRKDPRPQTIQYITVATASKEGHPWNSPVYSAFDEHYNFYWASWKENQHSINIRENSKIFIVIYDSSAPEGTNRLGGVYIKARAYQLNDPEEIVQALRFYPWRAKAAVDEARKFLQQNPFTGTYPRRIFKAVPEKVWLNDIGEVNDLYVDKRVEITLT